jgi:hypothetical protein
MAAPEELIRLRATDLEWTEVDDQVVVLDLSDAKYLAVNSTGAAIWPRLAEGATRTALLETLKERFDVGDEDAQRGLDEFLDAARERGLLA